LLADNKDGLKTESVNRESSGFAVIYEKPARKFWEMLPPPAASDG
jgi:hypothetical protein